MSDSSELAKPVPRIPVANSSVEAVAAGGTALLLGSFIGNGLNYAFGVFLARSLGSEAFGLYALGMALFNSLVLTVIFGFDRGIVRFVSSYRANGNPEAVRKLVRQAGFCLAIIACGASVCMMLAAGVIAEGVYGKPELKLILILFALAAPFAILGIFFMAATQAHQVMRYTVWIKYLTEPVTKFLVVILLFALGYGLLGAVAGIGLALFLSFLLFGVTLIRQLRKDRDAISGAESSPAFKLRVLRPFLVYCFPLALSNVCAVLAARADMLTLGRWANPDEIAHYAAAFQTSAIIALVTGAYTASLAPALGSLWAKGDRSALAQLFKSTGWLLFALTLPAILCMIVFAEEILLVFGRDFSAGSTLLVVLVLGQALTAVLGINQTMLLMAGHSRLVLLITLSYAAFMAASLFALVPPYGAMGAAVAAALGQVLTNALRSLFVWRITGLNPLTFAHLRICAAGTVLLVILLIGKASSSYAAMVLLAAIGFAIYCGGLFLMERDESRRALVLQILRRFLPSRVS